MKKWEREKESIMHHATQIIRIFGTLSTVCLLSALFKNNIAYKWQTSEKNSTMNKYSSTIIKEKDTNV